MIFMIYDKLCYCVYFCMFEKLIYETFIYIKIGQWKQIQFKLFKQIQIFIINHTNQSSFNKLLPVP